MSKRKKKRNRAKGKGKAKHQDLFHDEPVNVEEIQIRVDRSRAQEKRLKEAADPPSVQRANRSKPLERIRAWFISTPMGGQNKKY